MLSSSSIFSSYLFNHSEKNFLFIKISFWRKSFKFNKHKRISFVFKLKWFSSFSSYSNSTFIAHKREFHYRKMYAMNIYCFTFSGQLSLEISILSYRYLYFWNKNGTKHTIIIEIHSCWYGKYVQKMAFWWTESFM